MVIQTMKIRWRAKKFNMKNTGDYHNHYLKKDVSLLAVFETFIDTCLKFYKLDIDMYLFIEKGLRGGISYIAKRYSKANNKYMKNYDPKKPLKFITYLDTNNLYGWTMSDDLPYGEFKWLRNADNSDVNSISDKS